MRAAAAGPTMGSFHGGAMRKHIDCREFPSDINCTLAMSADSENELLDAAVQHAVKLHGHNDSPEFRDMLRKILRDGEIER
jgi:predicted small metal-binding protein